MTHQPEGQATSRGRAEVARRADHDARAQLPPDSPFPGHPGPTTGIGARLARTIERAMSVHRARVFNGRLTLDEPSDLPDGTEVDVFVLADGELHDDDELDADDRARLHEAILASREEIRLGLGIPAAQILDELRRPGG